MAPSMEPIKPRTPKFTQIVTGVWKNGQNYQHTLYALSIDGDVYRYYANVGWTKLKEQMTEKFVSSMEDTPHRDTF